MGWVVVLFCSVTALAVILTGWGCFKMGYSEGYYDGKTDLEHDLRILDNAQSRSRVRRIPVGGSDA